MNTARMQVQPSWINYVLEASLSSFARMGHSIAQQSFYIFGTLIHGTQVLSGLGCNQRFPLGSVDHCLRY